jgi:hypothetical protein
MFIKATLWTQPRCPKMDKYLKKMWYVNIMEYYSAIKENKIISFSGTWMELQIIMLSEIN